MISAGVRIFFIEAGTEPSILVGEGAVGINNTV